MFHYSEVYLERGMASGIELGREMERASMRKILKREREQIKLEMEKHRLENEKFERKLQKITLALHRDGLSIEQIASYMAADTNEIVTLLENGKQKSCFHNTFLCWCIAII